MLQTRIHPWWECISNVPYAIAFFQGSQQQVILLHLTHKFNSDMIQIQIQSQSIQLQFEHFTAKPAHQNEDDASYQSIVLQVGSKFDSFIETVFAI